MIEIREDRCTLCGKCADVCPNGTIASERVDGRPRVFVAHPDWCNLCAHCLAVCEPRAVIVAQVPNEGIEQLGDIEITPGQMKNLLLARRSVRRYEAEPVSDEAVGELLEVAAHAGTGGNLQSVGFVVMRDRAMIDRLEEATLEVLWQGARLFGMRRLLPLLRLALGREATEQLEGYYEMFKLMKDRGELEGAVFRNAPAVVIAYDRKSNRMGALNCAIAMRNVEVMAVAMGLGTCWSGFLVSAANLRPRRINSLLGIRRDDRIKGALMLGHPKHTFNVKLPRKARAIRFI